MKKVLVSVIAGFFVLGVCMTGVAQEAIEEVVPVENELQAEETVAVEEGLEVEDVEMDAVEDAAVEAEIVVSDETASPEIEAVEEVEEVMDEAVSEEAVSEEAVSEEPMDEVADDNAMYTYGNVVTAGEGVISVLEYDFENDQDIEIGYSVNEETVFQNLTGLEEVQAGDEVEIMYEEADGQRVAKMVSKTSQNIDQ